MGESSGHFLGEGQVARIHFFDQKKKKKNSLESHLSTFVNHQVKVTRILQGVVKDWYEQGQLQSFCRYFES